MTKSQQRENGKLVGSAHASGGGMGCDGGMGPVVSDPPPPQEVLLAAGPHTLHAADRGAGGICHRLRAVGHLF